jgi:hypothetical protein
MQTLRVWFLGQDLFVPYQLLARSTIQLERPTNRLADSNSMGASSRLAALASWAAPAIANIRLPSDNILAEESSKAQLIVPKFWAMGTSLIDWDILRPRASQTHGAMPLALIW